MELTYKKLYRLGIAVYAVLFIFAVVFYKERILFLDSSYYLFNIVKLNDFSIQHNRFIAVLTEIFPLLAVKLSWTLEHIALTYSCGFIIYYFTCYMFCGSVLGNYRMAIVLLLYQTLICTHTYYWMLSEYTMGVALMMPLLAYIEGKKKGNVNVWGYGCIAVVVTTLVFAHPLMIFPFSFALLFLALQKDKSGKRFYLFAGCMFILIAVLKHFYFTESYDEKSMSGVNAFITIFPDYFNIHSNKVFIRNCTSIYYWVPVLFILIVIVYVKTRQPKPLLLFIVCFFGYLLLINVSYWYPGVGEYYIENLYLPLGLMLSLPIVYDVLPVLKKQNAGIILIAAILLTGIIRVYKAHAPYTRRLDWERKFLDENIGKKLVMDEKKVPADTLISTWGSAYEFWLLSMIEYKRPASIVITDHVDEFTGPAMWENKAMLTIWEVCEYNKMPVKYFPFTDTVNTYTVIK